MTIAELTPPVGETLTLAEVKAHLRLDGNTEDTLLSELISSARQHLERETGLVLMATTFRLYLDDWPDGPVIQIARHPLQTIDAITLYDEAGDPFEADTTGMVLDGRAHPARLVLPRRVRPGQALNGIEIDFTAGFGASGADVPDTLKRAMLLHIALLYEFRGAVSPKDQPAAVPAGYERLIAPFRRRGL
ncbi:putative phiE125 gp8 family phage protein [Pararhizobium capsulatum DSM 1112]|uniref:PhiE125 gp8 family phage protein n=1 Tax=Pararhizobium capsulatum DSM 1112 TaxID=1121113 RepID=A0ABU0BMW6_9HYPH|nr:head-tail connector protein [Pararhizobium capsulatum]MDQ0319602.1 putative phiE125 gp8 family phage protein [Pararhizobium capsulatum DSM 1112]